MQGLEHLQVSCPSLEKLSISSADSISSLFSHQLPYFSKLQTLEVENCVKLRNLMSPSMYRCLLNLRTLNIENCESMEEVITEEEHQGEEMTNEPLFPLLEKLTLQRLPKLEHFFLTKHALKFPFLIQVYISQCPKMKTFVQQGVYMGTTSLNSVNNDDEMKAMFNSKISCPNLEVLSIYEANSISALCSHQLPTDYFTKLQTLNVWHCGKLRNLMSPSVARGALNLQILKIDDCPSMEEVITKEEQQGERIMTLFPFLEELKLSRLPKLGHFFLTEHALEFPLLRNVTIDGCPGMKPFVQQGISVSTPILKCDDEVNVDDLNKTMFNYKIFCPNLEHLYIWKLESISALCSHQLPTDYFTKLQTLNVSRCGKLRNLMSPSVARGAFNLQILKIDDCPSMEEVITEEEQQGEGIMTLFPLLEELELSRLPKLGHFFLTEHALTFPFLRKMKIDGCPGMKPFVQQGISVSTPILKCDDEVNVDDLNKAMFNYKIFCPNLEHLYIWRLESISALCSHQLPTDYFTKLQTLNVWHCGKLRNLMSPSVARGALNLQILEIDDCPSMEEVITEEEQQGEGIMTLFPLLEELELSRLPKLGHFFLTEHALTFPFLRKMKIDGCPEMKTFVQQGISVSTPILKCDDEVNVDDLNKAMFNYKIFCPNLEHLYIWRLESISALCSHQLPTDYFTKLQTLNVWHCGKLRNLMSPSVARGALNLQILEIEGCESMEEVIKEEEQQGEGIMTLFPLLEELELSRLPKLGHFFLTEHALEFPLLRNVTIRGCPGMKTFVQQGISVSTPILKCDDEVKVDDLNNWIQQRFNSQEQSEASDDDDEFEASDDDESEATNGDESEATESRKVEP
ncbi:hypothetical protein H5410_054260 [Solanum commersonii]|uniref:Disease resistance protein At4g27190-like leucine-rich repeats domain-containing protein n=1 Tax=Solanum commersonii TaxID=4109 RepID=A0A9J5X5Q6_SOLCO|nr:hypothetical protein H5410_054260 [Solanum commersonii]